MTTACEETFYRYFSGGAQENHGNINYKSPLPNLGLNLVPSDKITNCTDIN